MTDRTALLRVLNELVWVLRREGFAVSTAQALDVLRAVEAVGFERMAEVRQAVAAVVLRRADARPGFDATFDRFFSVDGVVDRRESAWRRLRTKGFTDAEIDAVTTLTDELGSKHAEGSASLKALLERGAALDRLLALAGTARSIDAQSGLQVGFRTHRLLTQLGARSARQMLADVQRRLGEAAGVRGLALAEALTQEFRRFEEEVRSHVQASYLARVRELERVRKENRLDVLPFAAMSTAEIENARRRVRRFVEALRDAAQVRPRRFIRGGVDPHQTLRRAVRTGGIPFHLVRRTRSLNRSNVILLCDVSDSVRACASILLEFTYAAQKLLVHARSFVFVSELGEATQLFAREPVQVAVTSAWQGGIVRQGENSNYGRVFRELEARFSRWIDRRTTIVVLGDGRTNYHSVHADVLHRLRRRSRALLWLCPEPRGLWGQGDSAMASYAPACTEVYEVGCARDLEGVARVLVGRR